VNKSEQEIQKSFTIEDQHAFAILSGDYNPLHLDSIYARRMISGGIVVHGVHLLLWALDCWLKTKEQRVLLEEINGDFHVPALMGREIRLTINKDDHDSINAIAVMDGKKVVVIRAIYREYDCSNERANIISTQPDKKGPIERDVETLKSVSGKEKLLLDGIDRTINRV